jgi:hypothetical protein
MIATALALYAELAHGVVVPRNQYVLTVLFDIIVARMIGEP